MRDCSPVKNDDYWSDKTAKRYKPREKELRDKLVLLYKLTVSDNRNESDDKRTHPPKPSQLRDGRTIKTSLDKSQSLLTGITRC